MHFLWLFIKFLFWLTVTFSFLIAFLTHFILWTHLRLLSLQDEHPASLPLWTLTKSFVIEFLCIFAACLLMPFQTISFKSKTLLTDTSAPPILLVHGYFHHKNAWIWIIRQLRKKVGIGPMYTINLAPPFISISKLAEQVQNQINIIQAETGAKKVILVGHSTGGLVCSYFCEFLAKPNQVAKLIVLGTPFKGTIPAALAYGKPAQEMAPNSTFLSQLTKKMQQSSVPYFLVASKIDSMVVPWESATPEAGALQTVHLEDYGHLKLLISPAVIEQLAHWIVSP